MNDDDNVASVTMHIAYTLYYVRNSHWFVASDLVFIYQNHKRFI